MKSTKMQTNIKCFLILAVCVNSCVCKKYFGYTLFSTTPAKSSHIAFLKNLSHYYEIDFWTSPEILHRPLDFVVSPVRREDFMEEIKKKKITLTTKIENIQKAFDKQSVKVYITRKMETFDWYNYFRVNDIYQWLRDLAKVYPDEMELMNIGRTYENRFIIAVKIVLKGSKKRSTVMIEGGIHAREWISTSFVTFMINQIIHSGEIGDPVLRQMALTYVWYFVPVLNPDGYEYSHVEDRLWRKNRHNFGEFFGVDLNRNFDRTFGVLGGSMNPESGVFCGTAPFSEKESHAMGNFIRANSRNLEYYFAFHSYGQYMILPYADSKRHQDNYDEVKKMCDQAIFKIASRYNTRYIVGTAYDTVGYLTSGVSACWVKQRFRIPYVVLFELRDNGTEGFALPPHLILPTCRETMDGVISLLSPRSSTFEQRKEVRPEVVAQADTFVLDKIVLVCNALLFIIVRFD